MGARRIRREQRQADMVESRKRNSVLKVKERERRDKRMTELVKNSQPPYTPAVQSWLSQKLDKPSTRITQEDVAKVIQG